MVKNGVAFVETQFVPLNKAKISVGDLGFQRGAGIFETLRTYGRRPFALRERLERIFDSARILGFDLPFTRKRVAEKVFEGIKKVKSGEVLVKIIVTGGESGKSHFLVPGKSKLILLFTPFHFLPETAYEKGIKVMTSKHARMMLEIKSLSYLSAVAAHQQASLAGFDEAVYLDSRGNILEGTTFNFAIIRNKALITPVHGILEGITMDIVLKLAKKIGLRIKRHEIKYADLKKAQEAFITSASREALPVVKVDKIKIGYGNPGKYTKLLLEEYRSFAKKQSKNY